MLIVIVHLQCIAELSLCIFALALLECRSTLPASWISFVWVLVVAALTVFCSLCWCQQRNFVFQNKCGLYFLPNTSLRAIPELDWHTVFEKFMWEQ